MNQNAIFRRIRWEGEALAEPYLRSIIHAGIFGSAGASPSRISPALSKPWVKPYLELMFPT
uniref:Uncharacterized protein n=1 Tax=Candidatus Kentrum eta TaxID=2126337 RepID=A0A450UYB4_9GAMM|nr:MAG: hypothetical protein BECKH772A_GA0070896_1001436 [Candidatus Kentron sp. H]VFJ91158.1 MAG: hypothetical protein BECKH772B_GA0070898_1001436 [Candidatus Kentron sp. H]VFJ97502.1 MAG: hypothetical protein BECKH772C_GA0070978_1001336 [Candidatus Kentron sp. H]